VTFVVSLFNDNEIVIAADTLQLDGSLTPVDKPFHKIKSLGPHVFAAAGMNAGYDIHAYLVARGFRVNENIEVAANEFYIAAKEAYQALDFPTRKYNETSMMLAGFGDDGANVYILKLPNNGLDSQQFHCRASIGIGTLSEFFRNYHTPEMGRNERIQLAHFCVSLTVAKNSSMVRGPVDLAILTPTGGLTRYESEPDNINAFVEPFRERSEKMVEQLDSFFLGMLPKT